MKSIGIICNQNLDANVRLCRFSTFLSCIFNQKERFDLDILLPKGNIFLGDLKLKYIFHFDCGQKTSLIELFLKDDFISFLFGSSVNVNLVSTKIIRKVPRNMVQSI